MPQTDEFGGELIEAPVQDQGPASAQQTDEFGGAPIASYPEMGKFPGGFMNGMGAFAQGALDTALAGTPEALAHMAGVDTNSPDSLKNQFPKTYLGGQVAGALVPMGELGKGAGLLEKGALAVTKPLIKQAMRMGGIYGAGNALSSEVKNGQEDPVDAAVGAMKGAAAGVALGSIAPFATVGLVKGVIGAAQAPANIYRTFFPKAVDNIKSAIKMPKKLGGKMIDTHVKQSAEDLLSAEQDLGRPIQSLKDYGDAANIALKKVVAEKAQALGDSPLRTFDGSKVKDRLMKLTKDPEMLREDPDGVDRLRRLAAAYDGTMPIEEAEKILQRKNGKLKFTLWQKTRPGMQVAMSDIDIQAQAELVDELRKQVNAAMEASAGPRGAELNKRYGSLRAVADAAEARNATVVGQAQFNLPEQLSYAQSFAEAAGMMRQYLDGVKQEGSLVKPIVRMAATKWIKHINQPDTQIATAFNKLRGAATKQAPPVIPPKLNIGPKKSFPGRVSPTGPMPPTEEEMAAMAAQR